MRVLIVGLSLLTLAACGGSELSTIESSQRTATATSPGSCSDDDAREALASMDPLIAEFGDAFDRGQATSRIALSPVVADMQRIVREMNAVEVPGCAESTRRALALAYSATTDAMLAFQADEPYRAKFNTAAGLMESATQKVGDLRD